MPEPLSEVIITGITEKQIMVVVLADKEENQKVFPMPVPEHHEYAVDDHAFIVLTHNGQKAHWP